MRNLITIISVLALATSAASATELHFHQPKIEVTLAGQRVEGLGLRATHAGWRLALDKVEAKKAEIIDMTPGIVSVKWTLPIARNEVNFDPGRFIGGHIYRVVIRSSIVELGQTVVYLYPNGHESRSATKRTMVFSGSDSETPPSDEIPVMRKGSI
jgi:hypothetical protein